MMKNQTLCKVRPERHIPSELHPEILSRLPVKSLLRFRCVSKAWLRLVDDDADFARSHLKNFKNNSDETHLFVVYNNRCVVRRSDTFETDSGIIHPLGNNWDIVSSVDGLILLSSGANLKLWNPSNRNFRQVPPMPEIEEFQGDNTLTSREMGLCYDPLAKDYKIVIATRLLVLIYSLEVNSWKITEFQGKGSFSNWYNHWCPLSYNHRLYFKGCLYSLCCKEMVFFDLGNEVFSSVNTPICDNYICYDELSLALVDGGCSLAIVLIDGSGESENSVWVLETKSMSWTKRYSFQLKFTDFFSVKKDGDILLRRDCSELIIPENDKKKKMMWWDQVILYRHETNEHKIVHELKSSYYRIIHIGGFVESLILHK